MENVIANDIAVEVMEMVELYCELLLARAAVLDQIAFGDKGIRARSRAKEEYALLNQNKFNNDNKNDKKTTKNPAGGGMGFFSSPFASISTTSSPYSSSTRTRDGHRKEGGWERRGGEGGDDGREGQEGGQGEGREEWEREDYIDAGLDEAAAAIFYSWPRFPREVRELTTLRTLLTDRWGKDFAALAQDNKATVTVPERLVKRLRVKPPSVELVESYLHEIAKAYGIVWPREQIPENKELVHGIPDDPTNVLGRDGNDITTAGEGGDAVAGTQPSPSLTSNYQPQPPSTLQRRPDLVHPRRDSEVEELSRATPPRDIGSHDATGRSPVSVAPPAPRIDNPNPRVRIPGEQDATNSKPSPSTPPFVAPSQATTTGTTTSKTGPVRKDSMGSRIPDVDELSKRFAALKR